MTELTVVSLPKDRVNGSDTAKGQMTELTVVSLPKDIVNGCDTATVVLQSTKSTLDFSRHLINFL